MSFRFTAAANTGFTAIKNTRTCASFSRPKNRSPFSAAITTISLFRVTIWTLLFCALMKTVSPPKRRIISNGRKPARRTANSSSLRAIPGSTARLLTRRAACLPARRRQSFAEKSLDSAARYSGKLRQTRQRTGAAGGRRDSLV